MLFNGTNIWSCGRNSANNAWNANGNNGFFNNNNMTNSYNCVPVSNYSINRKMIQLEDLIEAYFVARSNKRKSPDAVEFELHWESNIVALYNDIVSGTFQPTAYSFIAKTPKPREVFASDFKTRILHHYLDIRLRPLLEQRLSLHTFNNRKGMGQMACTNAVIEDIYEVSEGFTNDNCWIIKCDLTGCFPNINQDIAYKQLEGVILADYHGEDKDELIFMLQRCIYSYPTHHCTFKSTAAERALIPPEKSMFTKPDGIGAAIGHLIWQNAVNYYFHEIDEWVLSMGIKYERFVDDMYFIVNNKEAFLSYFIPELRKRLGELGASLNEKKFYCQHYTKGCECLGTHIKMDRLYPNTRIINRGIAKAREFNRCTRPSKVQSLLSSINSYLGVCKNMNGYKQALRILYALNSKWMEYVEFDKKRVCLKAKEGYKYNDDIIKKFYGRNSKNRRRNHARADVA